MIFTDPFLLVSTASLSRSWRRARIPAGDVRVAGFLGSGNDGLPITLDAK